MTSLRTHLNRTLLGAILALWGVGAGALYFFLEDTTKERFDTTLRTKALAIITLTKTTSAGVQVDFTDHFMRDFDDRRPRDFFELWDGAGKTLLRSESLGDRHLDLRPGLGRRFRYWNAATPTGRPGRGSASPSFPSPPAADRRLPARP